jgi:hypothetical protein
MRAINLNNTVENCKSFDAPATQVTQDERPIAELAIAPFVLSALRSKVYRSMSGAETAVFK